MPTEYREFCRIIGALGAGATIYAVGQNNPTNRLVEELMKKHDEELLRLKERQKLERDALLSKCKANLVLYML